MRCRILAIVGFGLDNPAADAIDGEDRADQATRDVFGRRGEIDGCCAAVPQHADPDKVQARYIDGCLAISIGKSEASKPRAIAVQ